MKVQYMIAALFGALLTFSATESPSFAVASQPQEPFPSVYSAEQATSGRGVYGQHCAVCHGANLHDGTAPPLAGPQFNAAWSADRTLYDLLYLTRTTMPAGAGNSLSTQQYVDVVAFILQQNGYPSGDLVLTDNPDLLGTIRIESGLATESTSAQRGVAFIEGEDGMAPSTNRPAPGELEGASDNNRDWLFHTHDYTGRRYSSLSEINTGNVSELRPVCLYQFNEQSSFQTGPIVYDGVMYMTTAHQTVALNAADCRPIWKHVWEPQDQEVWLNNRGVAIHDGRVVRGTSDGYLFALDSMNGRLLWARKVADPSVGETFTMAPMIFEDLVLIGPAGSENAISGWVGAFRLADGTPVWRFNTVPGAREPGDDTWGNPANIVLGGGATWTPFSMDLEREELYVAVTNPAPDLPADLRPGSNLYTNSIVALDVRSGELRWYEQMVPNDDHDWDLTQVSPVFTTEIDGRQRNLVATVGKDGILRGVDRDTYERVYETAVTTIENVEAPVTTEGVRACPGVLGGVEWNGPALHPATNTLFVPAVDWCSTFTRAEEVRYIEGELFMGGTIEMDGLEVLSMESGADNMSAQSQGWLTAVDAAAGEVRWRYRSERPMVAAVTTTGGGLVLTGELTGDFLVLEAVGGEVLYRFNTGGPIGGGIVTYQVDGKQYIAVMSGSPSPFWVDEHPGSPTALIFALP